MVANSPARTSSRRRHRRMTPRRAALSTVVAAGDIDYLDPGAAYYQFTYMLDFADFLGG